MATDTLTTITQPAPLFEAGSKKYLDLLTQQTTAAGALKPLGATPTTRAAGYAPGVAQQSALAQAAQQQAATQAGLGTLGFDQTTGAISGLTAGTGIGGYQQYLDPAAAQAGTAGTTLGQAPGQITAAGQTADLAQPLLTQAGQDIGTAAGTLGGAASYLSGAAGLTGPMTAAQRQAYESPYQSQVRQATLDEYDTQAAAQRSAVTQQAGLGTVGNLDAGRFGVQLGAFEAQQQRDRALMDAQLNQQAFGQAQGARQQDYANQLGLGQAQQQYAGAQAGLGSQRQALAQSQQQLAGTQLGLGGAEQQLAQQQLGLGQYYGNLAQLQPQLAGQNLAIGQGLAGQDLQYRQAVEDASRQANQMAQYEPLQRLDRFGQGLTGVMGGLGSVQTQTNTGGAAAPGGLGSALQSGIGAFGMGKLFGLGG